MLKESVDRVIIKHKEKIRLLTVLIKIWEITLMDSVDSVTFLIITILKGQKNEHIIIIFRV